MPAGSTGSWLALLASGLPSDAMSSLSRGVMDGSLPPAGSEPWLCQTGFISLSCMTDWKARTVARMDYQDLTHASSLSHLASPAAVMPSSVMSSCLLLSSVTGISCATTSSPSCCCSCGVRHCSWSRAGAVAPVESDVSTGLSFAGAWARRAPMAAAASNDPAPAAAAAPACPPANEALLEDARLPAAEWKAELLGVPSVAQGVT